MVKRERTARKAILTEAQRDKLKGGKLGQKSRYKLLKQLDTMFPELIYDFYLLANSPELDIWRAMHRYEYLSDFAKLSNIFQKLSGTGPRRIYPDKIREKRVGRKRLVWVEKYQSPSINNRILTKKRPYYSEKLFEKEHMFAGTSLRKNPQEMETVFDAYEHNIIPQDEKSAIDIETIPVKLAKVKARQQKLQENPERRCPKCGYVASAGCDECEKRLNERLSAMLENTRLQERVMGLSIPDPAG